MYEVTSIVSKFVLRKSTKGYRVLCLVLQEAVSLYPQSVPLEQLCLRIQESAGGASSKSLQRTLGRTIDMIWDCATNHDLLNQIYQYPVQEKPSAKDFICSLVDYIKNPILLADPSWLLLKPTLSPHIFMTPKGRSCFVVDCEEKISPQEIYTAIHSIKREEIRNDTKSSL